MSDEKQGGQEQPDLVEQPVDTEPLEIQAKELRGRIRERERMTGSPRVPVLRKLLYSILVLFCLGGSVFLLIAQGIRQSLIERVASNWFEWAPTSGDEVLPLPAPPPKSTQPVVQNTSPAGYFDEGYDGVLYGDFDPTAGKEEKKEGDKGPTFVPPEKTDASQEAYKLLLTNSAIVRQLVDGKLKGYRFEDWSPVRDAPPEFLLDLTAVRESDSQEVHLVYQVDVERESVRPMSQAARDLSRGR